jgi:hypothetical protein
MDTIIQAPNNKYDIDDGMSLLSNSLLGSAAEDHLLYKSGKWCASLSGTPDLIDSPKWVTTVFASTTMKDIT